MVSRPHCCSVLCLSLRYNFFFFLRITLFHIEKYAGLHVQNVQHVSVRWINNKVQNTFPCSYKEQITLSYTTTKIVFECCRQRSFTYVFFIFLNSNAYNRVIYSHVPQSLEQQKGQIVFNYRRATTFYSTEVSPDLKVQHLPPHVIFCHELNQKTTEHNIRTKGNRIVLSRFNSKRRWSIPHLKM